jgi:hypothetical protein
MRVYPQIRTERDDGLLKEGDINEELQTKEAPGQRPIFPPPPEGSIVGAEAFHFRVRNGNGWFHLALVTRGLLHIWYAQSRRIRTGEEQV